MSRFAGVMEEVRDGGAFCGVGHEARRSRAVGHQRADLRAHNPKATYPYCPAAHSRTETDYGHSSIRLREAQARDGPGNTELAFGGGYRTRSPSPVSGRARVFSVFANDFALPAQ